VASATELVSTSPEETEAAPSSLDRWIISELNTLVQDVTANMDRYGVTEAARAIQQFVDDLSNWYVRRSRRRFWKSESDADKLAAYQTLYECLVTLSKLMSPFVPFVAEEMYQNLVRSVDHQARESVHLADFPTPNGAAIDQALMDSTRLAMRISSLGRAAREKAGVKVRQPLAEVAVKLRSRSERAALEAVEQQVLEELNVKRVTAVDKESDLVTYRVRARFDLLGPKYGAELPKIAQLVAKADPEEIARHVRSRQPVALDRYSLLPDEIEVTPQAREGYAVSVEGDYVVGVPTALTPELKQEGLAREIVHRIQTMRKQADFRIEEYINTYYEGSPGLKDVVAKFGDYVRQETLSQTLVPGAAAEGCYTETMKVEGQELTIGLCRRG